MNNPFEKDRLDRVARNKQYTGKDFTTDIVGSNRNFAKILHPGVGHMSFSPGATAEDQYALRSRFGQASGMGLMGLRVMYDVEMDGGGNLRVENVRMKGDAKHKDARLTNTDAW